MSLPRIKGKLLTEQQFLTRNTHQLRQVYRRDLRHAAKVRDQLGYKLPTEDMIAIAVKLAKLKIEA